MFSPCHCKAYRFNWQLEWLRSHLWSSLWAWLGCAETEPLAGVKLEFDLQPFFSGAVFLSGCKSNTSQKPKPSGKSMTGKNGWRRQSPSVLWGLSSPTGSFWKPWRTICWKTRLESAQFVESWWMAQDQDTGRGVAGPLTDDVQVKPVTRLAADWSKDRLECLRLWVAGRKKCSFWSVH